MLIKDLRKPYDLVLSLGSNCQVAHQIKRRGLRQFSGPLDWFVFGYIYDLNRALKNRFSDLMLFENLSLEGKNDHAYLVNDIHYDCLSVHDFLLEKGEWTASYPDFRAKFEERAERFFQMVMESKSTLFVRLGVEYKGLLELKQIIKTCVSGDFNILALNYVDFPTAPIERDMDIDGIVYVEIENVKDRWEGRDEDWDYLLNGITLK